MSSHLKVMMRSPTQLGVDGNRCWPSPGPINYHRKAALSLFKTGRLSLLLLSCLSLLLILIFLLLMSGNVHLNPDIVFPCILIFLLLMSGNVHLNPDIVFPCLVCAGNVTWEGRSVQCCTCSKWGPFKELATLLHQVQCSRRLSLLEMSSLLHLCFSWGSKPSNTVTSSSLVFPSTYTSTVHSGLSRTMQCSSPTLAYSILLLFRSLGNFSLCTFPPSCFWVFFYTSCLLL